MIASRARRPSTHWAADGSPDLPAGRYIDANPVAIEVLQSVLRQRGITFLTGRVWTTDAPYRETAAKIRARRSEGCVAVEMEASALAAVAAFRGVPLAQVLYGGDDLSGEVWDHRSWQSQAEVRDNLIDLAASAALMLNASRLNAQTARPAQGLTE